MKEDNKKRGGLALEYIFIVILCSLFIIGGIIWFRNTMVSNSSLITPDTKERTTEDLDIPTKYNIEVYIQDIDNKYPVQPDKKYSSTAVLANSGTVYKNPFDVLNAKVKKELSESGYIQHYAKLKDSVNAETAEEITSFTVKNGTYQVLQLFYRTSSFIISYDLDNGEVIGNPTRYTSETETFTLKAPIKKRYTFIGWTGSNGDTPELTVTIPKGSTGDRTYKANWAIKITETIYWGINSKGELHLSSTELTGEWANKGSTNGNFSNENNPWRTYASSITSAYIDNTIVPTSTAYWFYGLTGVASIEGLDKLDTSNVTDIKCMFFNCYSLTSLDLSSFNTSKVTDMYGVFGNCMALISINLSNFNTSKVYDMNYMFGSCWELTTIKASNNFNTDNVTSSTNMFVECSKLVGGNGTKYNETHTDATYAKIDTESTPGYFTKAVALTPID